MMTTGTITSTTAATPAVTATTLDFRWGSINLLTRLVTDPDEAPKAHVGTDEGWTIRMSADANTRGEWNRVA